MADEVTSSEIRTRRFDVVRKGYDRNQVEVFLAQIARQIDSLESRIAEISDSDISLGIDDGEAHARELAIIGGEIDVILEDARSAAEGMRSRARADAESWTSESKTYVEESTSQAEDQSRAARESAWDEGSTMLAAASEEAHRMVAEAETDALRIRAEAEREAIRHTSDAKRASEETIGAAENEAEGILASSRAESERVLRTANQSAELAQERARALEDRRAELLAELESTRSSIGDLETEIESKRQSLEEPEPTVAPDTKERTHHEPDGGSVRIVSGSKALPLTPVDADSFVAEVAELHRNRPVPESSPLTADTSQTPEASSPFTVHTSQTPEDRSQITVENSQSEGSRQPDDSQQPTANSPQPQESLQPTEEQPTAAEPVAEPEPTEDSIGSLFAQLREDSQEDLPVVDAQEREPIVESEESEPQPPPSSASAQTNGEGEGAEVASLIPMQNAALRTIKRLLVDLQNDALEQLRTDKTWVPGEEFTDRFSEPFNELAVAITGEGDDGGAASVFATDLYDAVFSAVEASRDAGSGERATAAMTSKVFRTWRSDEAERRVVAVAADLSGRT